ncbi:MAG: ATP-binding protein, partial [Pirellulaceae bacterium]
MNHDATWTYDAHIESDSKVANKTVLMIVENLQRIGWSEAELFGIHMALEEAIVNAIKHGNGLDPDKKVHVVVNSSLKEFYLKVTDEGPGFDPDDVPDPTMEENLEMGSGRGL